MGASSGHVLRGKHTIPCIPSNRGIVDAYASHRVERGRLTGRQMFETDASLALSDTAITAEAEAASTTGGGGGASTAARIEYDVDTAKYGGASDLLPDDEDDEDYNPGADGDDDEDDDEEIDD